MRSNKVSRAPYPNNTWYWNDGASTLWLQRILAGSNASGCQ